MRKHFFATSGPAASVWTPPPPPSLLRGLAGSKGTAATARKRPTKTTEEMAASGGPRAPARAARVFVVVRCRSVAVRMTDVRWREGERRVPPGSGRVPCRGPSGLPTLTRKRAPGQPCPTKMSRSVEKRSGRNNSEPRHGRIWSPGLPRDREPVRCQWRPQRRQPRTVAAPESPPSPQTTQSSFE